MPKTLLYLILICCWGCSTSSHGFSRNKQRQGFEKIVFHTSSCYGRCPVYHLEVDSNRTMKLYAEYVFLRSSDPRAGVEDTARMGYFVGMVPDGLFQKLIHELDTVHINHLHFNRETCCDGSIKTIISYYDGKRKFLRSMFPPSEAYTLIQILWEICEQSAMTRVSEPFYIEGCNKLNLLSHGIGKHQGY